MGNERFKSFLGIFSQERKAATQQAETASTRLERRQAKLLKAAQQRINDNQSIIDSWGIKDILKQIQSENLLGSQTEIIQGDTNLPNLANFESKVQILRWVDAHSFISLHWDYESPSVLKEETEEGAIVITEPMKHLCFGFLEGNPCLKYSTGDHKQYKSIWLKKGNLDKDLSRAINNAQTTSNWDLAAQIYP